MDILKLFLCAPAIGLLLFTGFRLSFASRWTQVRNLPKAFSYLFGAGDKEFTSLAALCAIVGGNLGVGNLSGTAVALRSGGPGFVVWMILIIMVTSIIKYATCYISISTRENVEGKTFGGPVVYLKESFKTRWASIISAIVTAICAITVGNLVQVNSLSISMDLIGSTPIGGGMLMIAAVIVAYIIDASYTTQIISKIVPLMTISYIALSTATLIKFGENILPSLQLILDNVFSINSFKNGAILAGVAETLAVVQVGALRGIFATDIGLGLEGTVHSLVRSNLHDRDFALQQSFISLISPLVVAIVTFLTTLVLLSTGVWTDLTLESTNMCFTAFTNALGHGYVEYVLIFLMFCFSFTTVLTWLICSKESISYVFRGKLCQKLWVMVFISLIPLGSICSVRFIWDIADLSISISIIVNTVGILLLFSKYRNMFALDKG